MSRDDGQAAIFAVALLALAAVAIAGLRAADARIADNSAQRWAGEAAVEAAASVIADAYAAELRARAAEPSRSPRVMWDVLSAPTLRETARVAASEIGLQNGGAIVDDVAVTCVKGAVTITASSRGTAYRASFAGAECSRP